MQTTSVSYSGSKPELHHKNCRNRDKNCRCQHDLERDFEEEQEFSVDAMTQDSLASVYDKAKKLASAAKERAMASKAADAIRRSSIGKTLNKAAEKAKQAYAKSKADHAQGEQTNKTENQYLTNLHLMHTP